MGKRKRGVVPISANAESSRSEVVPCPVVESLSAEDVYATDGAKGSGRSGIPGAGKRDIPNFPSATTFGNSVATALTYHDQNFRLLRRLTTKATSTYQDMRYGYDPGGNVTAIVDPVFGTQSFRYDDFDRLISATGPYGTGGATATRPFGYDQIGNLTLHCTLGDLAYPPSGLGNVGPHRVCGVGTTSCPGTPHYQYDLNGNLTSATPPTGPTYSIPTYDLENRPTKITKGATTTNLAYHDLLGRVTKSVVGGTTTTYIGRWYECTGGTCRKYIFAGDQRIALKEGSTATYIHSDHLSSSSVLTNGNDGSKNEQVTYYPFGQTRTDTDGSGNPISPGFRYKYTDQELDDTTGLYYYKARYYDAALGRFIQPDPIVPDLYDPQALNPYSYALNNPLKYTDPTGLEEIYYVSTTETILITAQRSPGNIPLTDPLPLSYTSGLSSPGWTTPRVEFVGGPASGFAFNANVNMVITSSYRAPAARAAGAAADVAMTGAAILSLLAAPEGPVAAPTFFERVFEPLARLFGRGGAARGTGEALKATAHGAERIAGATATRGGVLSAEQIAAVRASGRVLTQADGATVRILQNQAGRFNVVVEGERGIITTFENLSQKSLDRLANKYGWKE